RNMRTALHDHYFGQDRFHFTRTKPALFDLGCIRANADNIGLILAHHIGQLDIFYILVKDAHLIAASFADSSKVRNSKMGRRAGIYRQLKTWVNEQDTQREPPFLHRSSSRGINRWNQTKKHYNEGCT